MFGAIKHGYNFYCVLASGDANNVHTVVTAVVASEFLVYKFAVAVHVVGGIAHW